MKTFNSFVKDTLMNNPTVKSITGDLKSGNIDINKIKKTVTSKKGQEDLNDIKTKGLNTLIDFGKKKLTDFEKKVNK
tara:strand:+ start:395 stop:625 length:231 start_codon:yes stop_codon:yes gene_type:complete